MSKRVYISCHSRDEAVLMVAALSVAGHVITSTWHVHGSERPADDDSAAWEAKAKSNFDEIRMSNVFVLIASAEHLSREKCVPGGKFIEAGFAIGRRSLRLMDHVFTVGGVENGMLWHPNFEHVETVEELIRVLGEAK